MASANVANTLVVPLETKVSPFYDDFDESKNFHRILFRPGYAVQARELTQIQTILQNQIERFGRHIFVNGSSVIGGKIDTTEVITLNLATQYANADVVVANFKDKTIKYASGNNDVIARVVQVSAGTPTSPPALHVKYISGQEFGPGSTITTTTGNISANLVSTSNVSSNGMVSFIYDSIYFYNGYFTKVPTQAIVLSKHDRIPTLRVGLELQESIVTESDDTSLLDPALEASNYQAPGAARYKSELVYTTRSITSADDEKFIQIGKIENGVITEKVTTPIYSEIEEVLARRTYDESGNYIVRPFTLTIEDSPTDPANNFLLNISSGKAYLYGYETERQSATKIEIPRARDTATKTNYDLNLNYGNYVIVEDLQGVFNTQGVGIVDMHCVAQSEVSFANTTMYNSTKVGTVRVRDLEFYSGSTNVATRKFEYYFFDPKFRTITGTAASVANSNTQIVLQKNNTSTIVDAYAGAYIKINSGLGSGDLREIASYDGPNNRATVYTAFSQITGANTQYTISFDITDVDSFVQNTVYTTGATSNATATIAAESKDTGLLTGNTFVSEPNRQLNYFAYPDKYIAPGTTNESYVYRKLYTGVQFIAGESPPLTAATDENFQGATGANTSSTVMENFLVIVTDKQSSSRVVGEQVKVSAVVTSSTPEQATLSTAGGASDSFSATVYAKVTAQASAAQPRVKTLIKANTKYLTQDAITSANVFVSSTGSTANVYVNAGQVVILNPSRESSVIESLYLSDVISVEKIYAFTGNTAPAPNTALSSLLDVTERYEFDNGQRITHYDHAAIRLKPGYAPISGGIIVCTRAYKTTNDSGYFSVDSYPSLNTIITEEGVSIGTGYGLIPKFRGTRLSDVIDFRPVRPNSTNTENFTFNSSRVPVPATDFRSTYSHYLPRRDIVSLSLNKDIELLQGSSAVNPVFAKEPDRNLTLHRLSLNPYTVSKKDIVVETVDHRRYTMQDIAAIDRRLTNVEYSVSLNSLEKKATDILIEDVDGLDRTKYGILADSFNNHLLGESSSPDYSCAVDTTGKYSGTDGMLMPKLHGNYFKLQANTASVNGVSFHDDKVMLAYSTSAAISQPVATKTTPVAEYLFADFRGQLITFPDSDIWKDTKVLDPDVVTLPPPPPPPNRPPPPRPPRPDDPPSPPPDVVINGNVVDVGPSYEMLMALTGGAYGGLGALRYDPATGAYYVDDKNLLTVDGVVQTAGITFEQAANYVEAVLADLKGSSVNITADNVKFIAEVYNDLLNRPPEGAGLTYWAELYATGNYSEQEMYQLIVEGAIASNELTWVNLPDPNSTVYSLTPSTVVSRDDFNYSVAAGSTTTTYDGLTSPNYSDLLADDNLTRENTAREVINDLYQSYLGREAEAEGLDYWVGVYNEFGADAAISSFYDVAEVNISAGVEGSATGPFDPIGSSDEGSYSVPDSYDE